jgi:hypothetical protein
MFMLAELDTTFALSGSMGARIQKSDPKFNGDAVGRWREHIGGGRECYRYSHVAHWSGGNIVWFPVT